MFTIGEYIILKLLASTLVICLYKRCFGRMVTSVGGLQRRHQVGVFEMPGNLLNEYNNQALNYLRDEGKV